MLLVGMGFATQLWGGILFFQSVTGSKQGFLKALGFRVSVGLLGLQGFDQET